MSWLDVVTAYLGAVASGNVKAVKQLVSKDVKYKDGIMELNGIDELLTVVGPDYRIQIQNWAATELKDRYGDLLYLRTRKSGLIDIRFKRNI